MVTKIVWCLFILLFTTSGNRCSPTERDLYAFEAVANADFGEQVPDAEPAETNTYSNPYSESTDVAPEDSSEDPPGPPDHVIPYSEHEDPGEVPTRPKYVAPGVWAKPDPKKNIPLDFVPTKTLAQVRGTHTVKVLPQSEALAAATSVEERENAPRLRQVVSKKKTNTIYTEEGYEDSAYDHAGHIRDADFHEGYARKLHDQRQSEGRSGSSRRKKPKRGKLRTKTSPPKQDEFEEFADDYSDERAKNEKYEVEESKRRGRIDGEKVYKDAWKNPEINPKIVAENEIEKLEDDLKREAEEVEKGSENYESATERELLRTKENEDSEEFQEESRGRLPSSRTQENFYKENHEATTLQFEIPTPRESEQYEASTLSYDDPTTLKFYIPEGSAVKEDYETTTFDYGIPKNHQLINTDVPTTVNYGNIFWNYFRSKPNEATTPYPQEQNPPMTLATVNGHGPYLLVSGNGVVTQNPSQFGTESTTYYPQSESVVQNGHQYTNPFAISNQRDYFSADGQVANSRSGYEFPAFGNSPYSSWGLGNTGYSSLEVPTISTESPTTKFYDNIAFPSTTSYSVITFPPNEYASSEATSQRDSSHRDKPFGSSVREAVQKVESYERENFDNVEKGWPKDNKNSLTRGSESIPPIPESGKNKALAFFKYSPNLKYTKILNHLKNQQNDEYDGQKSESAEAEDFTIMKPPTPRESIFSDFTLNSYPNVADYSSMMQESGAAQKINGKQFNPSKNLPRYNDLSNKGIHSKSQKFYANNLPASINRKKLFPPSKLLPPAPDSRDNYADYIPTVQSSAEYNPNFRNFVKNYNPDPKQLARYFDNRKLPTRFPRSLDGAAFNEEKIADAVIAQEIKARFNFTFEDQGSTQHRAVRELRRIKSRVKRNPVPEDGKTFKESSSPVEKIVSSNENENSTITGVRSLRGRRSHQDLLDASHKIASGVIDKEINSRFENKHEDAVSENEEEDEEGDDENDDEEVQREKQIEVELPGFDFLDEIQEVNNIDGIPTSTAASIDHRKYPFYKNNQVDNASPLKYIINPSKVPKKTFGGMEFYESRDKYIQCDEVDPNLDEVLPDDEEPVPNRGSKENLPRLRGLGDKLDCFKAKYFGENPFDSPLFFEKEVDQPTAPSELDPMKFAARILALPEENRKYFVPAQTKKPEAITIKRMDNTQQNGERQKFAGTTIAHSLATTRGRKRYNDSNSRLVEPSTEKPHSQSQKTRRRRPVRKLPASTTEATEIKPVTPYEKEVYDDVMGTIKNLASLYEMIESQTVAPITESTIVSPNSGRILSAPSIKNTKTSNRGSPSSRFREKDLYSSDEASSDEEIEGLLPPPEHGKKPKLLPYRTNKVSYNTRARTESPLRNSDRKIIGYYRTVMVHKRSLDGPSNARSIGAAAASDQAAKKWNASDSEFDESRVNYRTVSPDASPSPTVKPNRKRRRKTDIGITTTTTAASVMSETSSEPQDGKLKSAYTVRTRSKNSKDRKSLDRYGIFTTTQRTTSATDDRRREPRYREIVRRRGQTATITTTANPQKLDEANGTESTVNPKVIETSIEQVTEPGETYESNHSIPRRRKVSIVDSEPSSEIYKTVASEFEPEHVEADDEDLESYEEESTDPPEKSNRKYDVHEDVQEETTPSIIGFRSPIKTSDHVDLETYLSTDPPGFREAFAEEPDVKSGYVNADEPDNKKDNNREEVAEEEKVEDEEGEYHPARQKDSHREVESLEEDYIESPKSEESYKDSSNTNVDDSSNEEKNPGVEDGEVGTFFKFNARPNSPFESFEDEKYSDLGPRINKPAFHHPHFEPSKYEGYSFDDSEKEEKGESEEKDKPEESSEKGKYEFPWAHDEEDEKAEARERYVDEATEKYEYPWEKRERLAEERKKRRKDNERLKKLRDFSFFDDVDDDDEDEDEKKTSSSEIDKKVTYPWQYYDDVPSKAKKKSSWKIGGFDNEEVASNHRPVAKFSSKYSSSKFKLPFHGSEPISVAEPKKIRKSVLNFLRDVDEKSAEPTAAYKTDIPKNVKKFDESDQVIRLPSPNSSEKKVTSPEPVSSGSRNNKRISNSGIVPENITMAPRKANRTRVIPVRERTTLRPSVKSTTDASIVLKIQTTVTPITTTRTPWRLRGRNNVTGKQPSYAAEENRVLTSTILPAVPDATTQKPNQKSERSFVRKRGYPKNTESIPGSNALIKTNPESQEAVTQRSRPATTTVRRRIKPTVTTAAPIIKLTPAGDEKEKRPSNFLSRNRVKETTYDKNRVPTLSAKNSKPSNLGNAAPTSRTVEHRSQVSKEEIITKTSFPNKNAMYKIYTNKNTTEKNSPVNIDDDNEPLTNRESQKTNPKTPTRVENSFMMTDLSDKNPAKNDESAEKLSLTPEEKPESVQQTKQIVNKDYFKSMSDSVIPGKQTVGPTALEDKLHLKKTAAEEVKKKTDQGFNFDEMKMHTAKSNEEDKSISAEDSSVLSQELPKSPPQSNELKDTNDSSEEIPSSEEDSSTEYGGRYNSEYEDSDESEEDESSEERYSPNTNIEKDPSQRMYYFLEDKK